MGTPNIPRPRLFIGECSRTLGGGTGIAFTQPTTPRVPPRIRVNVAIIGNSMAGP